MTWRMVLDFGICLLISFTFWNMVQIAKQRDEKTKELIDLLEKYTILRGLFDSQAIKIIRYEAFIRYNAKEKYEEVTGEGI